MFEDRDTVRKPSWLDGAPASAGLGPSIRSRVTRRRTSLLAAGAILLPMGVLTPSAAGSEVDYPYDRVRAVEGIYTEVVEDLDADGNADLLGQNAGETIVRYGAGDGSFDRELATGPMLSDLATGDLDGDGAPDIAGCGEDSVVEVLGRDGGFDPPRSVADVTEPCRRSLDIGDIDSDGFDDVAILRDRAPGLDHSIDVYRGSPEGLERTPVNSPIPFKPAWGPTDPGSEPLEAAPTAIAVGTLDRSAGEDAIVTYGESFYGDGAAQVMTSTGAGALAPTRGISTGFQNSASLGDLNADGLDDVVFGAASLQSGANSSLEMNSDSGFTEGQWLNPRGMWYGVGAAFGDIDGDGDVDFAGSYQMGSSSPVLFLSNGDPIDPSFDHAVRRDTQAGSSREPSLEDLNGDGRLDLVSSGQAYDRDGTALASTTYIELAGEKIERPELVSYRAPQLRGRSARAGMVRLSTADWKRTSVRLRVPRRIARKAGLRTTQVARAEFTGGKKAAMRLAIEPRIAQRFRKRRLDLTGVTGVARVSFDGGVQALRLGRR